LLNESNSGQMERKGLAFGRRDSETLTFSRVQAVKILKATASADCLRRQSGKDNLLQPTSVLLPPSCLTCTVATNCGTKLRLIELHKVKSVRWTEYKRFSANSKACKGSVSYKKCDTQAVTLPVCHCVCGRPPRVPQSEV
jgi:hypothetical protein